MSSIDNLNDDVLFIIMSFQKPRNVIFFTEVCKRFNHISKKNFKIQFPKKKDIINNSNILSWAYDHCWKNKITLKLLLENKCSIYALQTFHDKYKFSNSKKNYYSIAKTIEQLNWLKKNRFNYTSLDMSRFDNLKLQWIKENLIFDQEKLLDFMYHHPNDFDNIEFACKNIYNLRMFVHIATVMNNNFEMLEWSAKTFVKEFNQVKEHEDLFILNAQNGNLQIAKFLLTNKVPFTGLTLKIAKEENNISFIKLLTQ